MSNGMRILIATCVYQIQKGKFTLSGTPNYMAPILKSSYLAARKNVLEDVKMIDIDLFKADVYSLGLTFLQAATNLKIDKINESADYMELAEKELIKTQFP